MDSEFFNQSGKLFQMTGPEYIQQFKHCLKKSFWVLDFETLMRLLIWVIEE